MSPDDNELLDADVLPGEGVEDASLRPRRLADFVGQPRVRRQLEVVLQGAVQRGQAPDHVLLSGPPGLGKTTLAAIIATEIEGRFRATSGPALERPGDLAAILTNLEPGDVLFVDEIHRLGRALEEVLYPALEDFALDLVVGTGPAARTVRLELPHFTLVGATTRVGLLSPPLRDRFGIVEHLGYYGEPELRAIAERSAGILGIRLDADGAREISRRSRGTPRIVNRLLRRVRDFVQVDGGDAITGPAASAALERMEVDRFGLDEVDRRVLGTILDKFGGGPVGLATIAAAVGEDRGTIEEIYEPYLMQIGFLDRTPRGRRVTGRARRHLLGDDLFGNGS